MERKIKSITFNWYFSPQNNREEYTNIEVGKKYNGKECIEIREYYPFNPYAEYDRLYYDIIYDDGSEIRIFNPCIVESEKEK